MTLDADIPWGVTEIISPGNFKTVAWLLVEIIFEF